MRNKKLLRAVSIGVPAVILCFVGVLLMNREEKKGPGTVGVSAVSVGSEAERADVAVDVGSLKCVGRSEQAVVVTAAGYGESDAFLQTYEKNGSVWKRVMAPVPAVVGVGGFAAPGEKREGDHMSPSGAFPFDLCFGNKPDPGVKLEYRQVDSNSYWVDDPESKYYNTFQTGSADGRWSSAEDLGLTGTAYDYAAVIGYNTKERTPGLGSAIFLHIWGGPGSTTAGCTAVSEENLLSVLKWLDPAKDPVIIQGVIQDVLKM